ncbi:MAG: hypothetical protein ACI4RA_04570 [Kiritimatiellia bacterium]
MKEEMDEGLRAFAASLRAAPQARTSPDFTARVMGAVRAERRRRWLWRAAAALPIAAGFAVLMAVGTALFRPRPVWSTEILVACQRGDGTFSASSAAPYVQAFAVTALAKDRAAGVGPLDSAVGALVRDQTAEGGWASPSLSARNVVALRAAAEAGAAGAQRAYRRGRRYLHANGIGELSAGDLVRAARAAVARLGGDADRGLACSVALCAR